MSAATRTKFTTFLFADKENLLVLSESLHIFFIQTRSESAQMTGLSLLTQAQRLQFCPKADLPP